MIARLKLYAIGVGAFIAAMLGVYLRGRHDEAEAEQERELNEYIETRKRIDGVRVDDAERWLRERSNERDL
jgi:hypothetical protein